MNVEKFKESDVNRIILSEVDFLRLVRGGVVRVIMETRGVFGLTRRHVAIGMQDIGYDQMHLLIEEAEGLR